MQKNFAPTLLLAAVAVLAAHRPAQAQTKPAPAARYADLVGENPTTEADIQTVTNFLNFLVAGDTDKARLLLTDTYRSYGPAATDSASRDQLMASWQQRYKTQLNRKLHLDGQTAFRVKSGRLVGNWVATWGVYTSTVGGKTVRTPFQMTAHVTKGTIDLDRFYFDNLSPAQALGYKLTPPATTAAAK
jgi:ketosteroid isomerase-like protein